MSLANRLAQLDAELDAFQKPPESLDGVRARLLASRSTDLAAVDSELDALAADIAGLDAVLEGARQQASSRAAQMASMTAEQTERARAARAEVDARVAALSAEQEAARAARAARTAQDAAGRETAAAQRAQQAATDQALRETAAAQRAEREATERAERAAQAAREREVATASPASSPARAPSMDESAATTLSQLLADELDDELSDLAMPSATAQGAGTASDDTDIFGTDLFGDLGADAFDAPQDRLDDVVSSDDHGAKASAFMDLASLLEQEEARPAESASTSGAASESDDLMSALFAETPEEPVPPPAEARPKTVPPPVPTPHSVRPPALAAAVIEGARESFEDLSDEIDVLDVDDFDIVIDESGLDEGTSTGTELDGPGLSAEELAPDAMHTTPDGPEDPDKKGGFFKKLFR